MVTYDRITYDTGKELSVGDKTRLEKDFSEGEWLVCSNELAEQHAKAEIMANLWAFRSEYLAGMTGLPQEAFSTMQEKLCEDCNDAVLAMIRATCGIDRFVEEAIAADGRGQFIASYDGEEVEYTTRSGRKVFLYRCN